MSSGINWSDKKAKISKYFTVAEATFLPRLGIYHTPNDQEKAYILDLAARMDKVRELLNKPITVNVWIRPTVIKDGKTVDYNALVGGAKNSSHKVGAACDVVVKGMAAQKVRDALKDHLEALGLYMEDDVSWCHFQSRPTKSGKHIFKP